MKITKAQLKVRVSDLQKEAVYKFGNISSVVPGLNINDPMWDQKAAQLIAERDKNYADALLELTQVKRRLEIAEGLLRLLAKMGANA